MQRTPIGNQITVAASAGYNIYGPRRPLAAVLELPHFHITEKAAQPFNR